MRILLVAMSESIHTARWIAQIADQGWELHLFPSIDCGFVHPQITNIVVHHFLIGEKKVEDVQARFYGTSFLQKAVTFCSRSAAALRRRLLTKIFPRYRAIQLKRLMDRLKPDIVHSLEIQHAGYLALEARMMLKENFTTWIVTNWGSDIHLFGRVSEHKQKIREVLNAVDFYSCECERDVGLAKAFGLKGKVLSVFPNAGGFDLKVVSKFRQPGSVSERRVVMLKGYQHFAGRALVGLHALERCADLLREYEVFIYSPTPDVARVVKRLSRVADIPIRIVPKGTPHNEILKLHGRARISIGLSISDAISTSLLEAMVMGSFPIQSWTACADEWIEDGNTGLLVPPEDPEVVENAIRRALNDDELVNRAAEVNYRLAAIRLDQTILKPKAVEIYNTVAREKNLRHEAN